MSSGVVQDEARALKFVQGQGDAPVIRNLGAVPEYQIQPEDHVEEGDSKDTIAHKVAVQTQKKQRELQYWIRVRQEMDLPGARFLDQRDLQRLREIDMEEIWVALDKEDQIQINFLRTQRQGIMWHAQQRNSAVDRIVQLQAEIEQLEVQAEVDLSPPALR